MGARCVVLSPRSPRSARAPVLRSRRCLPASAGSSAPTPIPCTSPRRSATSPSASTRSGEMNHSLVIGRAVLVFCLATPAAALDLSGVRLVDLTHPFDRRTIYWPTARRFTLEPVAHGMTEGGYWYAANDFCAAEHGGTHLDAPIHFAKDRWTADEVPLDRLVGAAVGGYISGKAHSGPDALPTRPEPRPLQPRARRLPPRALPPGRSRCGPPCGEP